MSLSIPTQFATPFAEMGARATIPELANDATGRAGYDLGFPPRTFLPKLGGGIPPWGVDMNGILYAINVAVQYIQAGSGFVYDSTFSTAIGGYRPGARVQRTDGTGYWLNTIDGNSVDPEASGAAAAGWVPDYTNGIAAVTMTSANVTLTSVQYGKPIIVITGTITTNLSLIFPNIAGEWTVLNNTTGAFTVTLRTASGSGVVVNSTQSIWGDGTNIYSATTDALSLIGGLIASAGGAADAITASFSPAPRVWPTGVPFFVRAATANLTTAPTFTANSGPLAAKTIVKGNNLALAIGDIAGAGHWLMLQYDAVLDRVVLLNPAFGVLPGSQPGEVAYFATSAAPSGYLKANGATVSRTAYAALYAAICPSLGTLTVTIASPGVLTITAHGLRIGDRIRLFTTGALPTGLTANTDYYVQSSPTANTFTLSGTFGGAVINTSGSQSGVQSAQYFPFGAGDGSTTFGIPDLRAEFVFGLDDGRGIDTGRVLGTSQAANIGLHSHTLTWTTPQYIGDGAAGNQLATGPGAVWTSNAPLPSTTGSSGGAAESRPRNVALLACIRY